VRNPTGRNQHSHCPPPDDERVIAAIREYQTRNITSNQEISRRLQRDHSIIISAKSIQRRRKQSGILGPRQAAKAIPEDTQRQMVLDQMANDPLSNRGPRVVQENISGDTGTRLPR
ncbi:hypothetical protein BDZ89DRAFT_882028, partial [Hymenopellis radicata]